jgi:hypothetical protein
MQSDGATVVESATTSRAKTFMHSYTSAHIDSHAIGKQSAEAAGSMLGHSEGMAIQVDPLNPSVLLPPVPLGQTLSTGDQTSSSNMLSRGTSEISGSSDMSGESVGEALTEGEARGLARGQSKNVGKGKSHSTSQQEALIPQYEDRHSSWHSKDNVLYMAARTILSLPTGRAIFYVRGKTSYLNVPALHQSKTGK